MMGQPPAGNVPLKK